jgi:fatty-acyl-CoA synthase
MTAQNIPRLLQHCYQESPDQIAVTLLSSQGPTQYLSYHDLICGSAGYAHLLAQAGIYPGEVVILILNHGLDLVTSFFGAILHGAIPAIMPFLTEKLSPEHYRSSLEALFEVTAPAAVLTYPEFLPEVQAAAKSAHSIRTVLVSDQTAVVAEPVWAEMGGLERVPEDIVLLQHSSGTTGLQKGVALSHLSVLNQLEDYSQALRLNMSDVIVSWLPLYHDMGLIAGFIMPILRQVRLVLMSPFDWVRAPYRLMQAISQYRGTLCWLPNFAYNFCTQKIRLREMEGVDLTNWRAVINCSEPMHWQSHQAFLERFKPYGLQPSALATCYAMAENVFAVTQGGITAPVTIDRIDSFAFQTRQVAIPIPTQAEEHLAHVVHILSAGQPVNNTRLRVVDSNGDDLPERHVGEIAMNSNCMLTGYYHRPDLTQSAFLDGWYLTGDLGYLAEGELYVTGRKKDLIIVGGKNIYPQDLERLASGVMGVHPGRVVAFGMYNEKIGTEEVVLVAELEQFENIAQDTLDQISATLRQHVNQGSDIALRYVHLVGSNWLLKTSSGKIARAANRDKFIQETSG